MLAQFEQRKKDHIRLALDPQTQTPHLSQFEKFRLIHEALPEIDFEEVQLGTQLFKENVASPLFVSSMTAGHSDSLNLNLVMAQVCQKRNWAMGVGSQRRELEDQQAKQEWSKIRKQCPQVKFLGNIGLSQATQEPTDAIRRLVDNLEATALFVHLNPLQECLQPEGTPQFKGGLKALEKLVRELTVPVVVKETGCGFSKSTLEKLNGIGLAAVDVAGTGGTHWGRIEGGRSTPTEKLGRVAETFKDWGVSTSESVLNAVGLAKDYSVWASGGVRNGLQAALLLAMGAQMVGLAKPIIEAALQGEEALDQTMDVLEYELKVALFCTGCKTVRELREKNAWEQVRT